MSRGKEYRFKIDAYTPDTMPMARLAEINQEGSLDGVPIRVGWIKEWVPVHLQAGDTIYSTCVATRDVAKQLANYLFEGSVRVYGTGHWYRDEMGAWVLDKFRIRHFEPLNDDPLTTVVAGLRAIPGNEWNDISDPWAELEAIRHGVREQH